MERRTPYVRTQKQAPVEVIYIRRARNTTKVQCSGCGEKFTPQSKVDTTCSNCKGGHQPTFGATIGERTS